ncbi:MAG: right-handed parallel beta-helix repeat-containing protein [Anaerolineae bacterium]|nr:right-handed parallel beta-helix repeat-containing protein [Anaerolineae bacterium]
MARDQRARHTHGEHDLDQRYGLPGERPGQRECGRNPDDPAGYCRQVPKQRLDQGRLTTWCALAVGTGDQPIVFTSVHDDSWGGDTNHNGGGTWPNPGDWDGLFFTGTAGGSVLDYGQVLYGGTYSNANVKVTGAAITLAHSVIRGSSYDGLQWANGASGQITANEIANNLANGIRLTAASSPTIASNTLRDNRSYAVYLEGNSFPPLGGNTAFSNAFNAIGVYYGTLGSGTWFANPTLPYVFTTNLTLESASTLTIQPGTVVKFLAGTTFIMRGTLVAQGTEANPITFTSIKDDTVGGDTQQDGGATKPNPGDWGTIYFADTTNDAGTLLDYVVVRYAGASYNYGGGTATAGLTLDSASRTWIISLSSGAAAMACSSRTSPRRSSAAAPCATTPATASG